MLDGVMRNINVDEHILLAIKEDVTSEDVTTQAIMRKPQIGIAELICKEDGILAGFGIFKRTFELLGDITITSTYEDGDIVKNGDKIATVQGDIRVLLTGERTALNYLQRMSGIASFL